MLQAHIMTFRAGGCSHQHTKFKAPCSGPWSIQRASPSMGQQLQQARAPTATLKSKAALQLPAALCTYGPMPRMVRWIVLASKPFKLERAHEGQCQGTPCCKDPEAEALRKPNLRTRRTPKALPCRNCDNKVGSNESAELTNI